MKFIFEKYIYISFAKYYTLVKDQYLKYIIYIK